MRKLFTSVIAMIILFATILNMWFVLVRNKQKCTFTTEEESTLPHSTINVQETPPTLSQQESDAILKVTFGENFLRDVHYNQCDDDLGFKLLFRWRNAKKEFCSGSSVLYCHSIQQTRHQTTDTFCHGSKFALHLDKLIFNSFGGITASCKLSNDWSVSKLFSNLEINQLMRNIKFNDDATHITTSCSPKNTLNGTTFFIIRDGDSNLFHSMADFLNTFMTFIMLNKQPEKTRIVFLDEFGTGPFYGIWKDFAKLGVMRISELKTMFEEESIICLDNVVFAMPSGSNFIWKDLWTSSECYHSEILKSFSRLILNHYHLLDQKRREAYNAPIRITLSVRHAKDGTSKIGRKIVNEDELIKIINEEVRTVAGEKIPIALTVKDFGTISFEEQLKIVRNSDVYIGMHGAGMTHILFLPDEAVVIEMMPKSWRQGSMRNLAKWTGKVYLGWQNTHAENHINEHLWTKIDPKEFKSMIESAIHIVQSFHKGIGYIPDDFEIDKHGANGHKF